MKRMTGKFSLPAVRRTLMIVGSAAALASLLTATYQLKTETRRAAPQRSLPTGAARGGAKRPAHPNWNADELAWELKDPDSGVQAQGWRRSSSGARSIRPGRRCRWRISGGSNCWRRIDTRRPAILRWGAFSRRRGTRTKCANCCGCGSGRFWGRARRWRRWGAQEFVEYHAAGACG